MIDDFFGDERYQKHNQMKFEEYILRVAANPSEGLLVKTDIETLNGIEESYLVDWVAGSWDAWINSRKEWGLMGDLMSIYLPFQYERTDGSCGPPVDDVGTIKVSDTYWGTNEVVIETTIRTMIENAIDYLTNDYGNFKKITEKHGIQAAGKLAAYLRDCAKLLDDVIDLNPEPVAEMSDGGMMSKKRYPFADMPNETYERLTQSFTENPPRTKHAKRFNAISPWINGSPDAEAAIAGLLELAQMALDSFNYNGGSLHANEMIAKYEPLLDAARALLGESPEGEKSNLFWNIDTEQGGE
jgi:hypothetical protein